MQALFYNNEKLLFLLHSPKALARRTQEFYLNQDNFLNMEEELQKEFDGVEDEDSGEGKGSGATDLLGLGEREGVHGSLDYHHYGHHGRLVKEKPGKRVGKTLIHFIAKQFQALAPKPH